MFLFVLALVLWTVAVFSQWRKEKKIEEKQEEREKRDKERFEEEKLHWVSGTIQPIIKLLEVALTRISNWKRRTRMPKLKLSKLKCQRCNHDWFPRSNENPKCCPGCHSPYWAVPRKVAQEIRIESH